MFSKQGLYLIAWFHSGCLVPAPGRNPPSVMGPGGTALLREVPPLGVHQGPSCPHAPKAVLAALGRAGLWPRHTQDPSPAAATKFSHRILALAWHCKAGGLPREQGQKSSSPVALTLALTNTLSKKLCCKSLVWKENDSFHGSSCFFLIVDNINAWLIPEITAVGIFSL